METGDPVVTQGGARGVAASGERDDGRVFVRLDNGNSGWFESSMLTPGASKVWPPDDLEVKDAGLPVRPR